jgi:hypothetical protein
MLYHNKTIGTLAYMGGLPCNLEKFTWSWGQLIAFSAEYVCNPGERIHLLKSAVSHHQTARNQLAREFLGDWLLMLDMDHAFEPDLLARLLHRMHRYQLDVLSGLYCFRSETPSPVLYRWATGTMSTSSRSPGPEAAACWSTGGSLTASATSWAKTRLTRRGLAARTWRFSCGCGGWGSRRISIRGSSARTCR